MMKKMLLLLFSLVLVFTIVGCGSEEEKQSDSHKEEQKLEEKENKKQEDNKEEEQKEEEKNNQENKEENNNQQNNQNNNTYGDDDEIIELDDEENEPIVGNERVTVEEVINCDGCVFAYFSAEGDNAKRLGGTVTNDEYTTDINNIRTAGNKQRHNFFGLVLSGNTITKAYSCILKDNKIYCIQGSTDGAYHMNNVAILNKIFASDQCKNLSDGHNYWCSDGSYNGNSKTSGYSALHYETSCTIYGSDSNTGKLICH
jgi:hypothetical protein